MEGNVDAQGAVLMLALEFPPASRGDGVSAMRAASMSKEQNERLHGPVLVLGEKHDRVEDAGYGRRGDDCWARREIQR